MNFRTFLTRRRFLAVLWTMLWTLSDSVVRTRAQGTVIEFSQSDIDTIVRAHNNFRRDVEPTASNMQAVVNPSYTATAS